MIANLVFNHKITIRIFNIWVLVPGFLIPLTVTLEIPNFTKLNSSCCHNKTLRTLEEMVHQK